MTGGVGSQRSREHSEAGPSRTSDRSSALFRGQSPSSQESRGTPTQPPSSPSKRQRTEVTSEKQSEEDELAARRARRQKRREQEAYQIQGWENLYGGGGGKPVFARDPLPKRRDRPESSTAAASLSTSNNSSDRLTSSRTQASSSSKRASSTRRTTESPPPLRVPSSSAPGTSRPSAAESSTTQVGKRKTPSRSPQPPTKKSRDATSTREQPAIQEEDSDDDFEVVDFKPAPKRTRVDDGTNPANIVKASPSPDQALKLSQPTQSVSLRRSLSRAPSINERISPAGSTPISNKERVSPTSAAPSREPSQPRSSRASSSSHPGKASDDLTPEKKAYLTSLAQNAFAEGSSLAEYVRNVVRVYSATLKSNDPERPSINMLERQLADLGPHAGWSDIQVAAKSVRSKRLGRRLAIVFHAWSAFQGGLASKEAGPSSSAVPLAKEPDNPPAMEHAEDASQIGSGEEAIDQPLPEVVAGANEARPSPATAAVADDLEHTAATEPETDARNEEMSSEIPVGGADPDENAMGFDPVTEPEARATDSGESGENEDGNARAGRASSVDSAGSPQAFGTPPEEPVSSPREAPEGVNETASEAGAVQQELQQANNLEDGPREASTNDEEPQEADESSHHSGHEEEEDELVDEVEDSTADVPAESGRAVDNDQTINAVLGTDDHSIEIEHPAEGNDNADTEHQTQTESNDHRGDDNSTVARHHSPTLGDPREGAQEDSNEAIQQIQPSIAAESDLAWRSSTDTATQLETSQRNLAESHPKQQADEQSKEQREPEEPQQPIAECDQQQRIEEQDSAQVEEQEAQPSDHQNGEVSEKASDNTNAEQREEPMEQPKDDRVQPITESAADVGTNEDVIDKLEPVADQAADQVATAVGEVEEALAFSADVQPAQPIEDAANTPDAEVNQSLPLEQTGQMPSQATANAERVTTPAGEDAAATPEASDSHNEPAVTQPVEQTSDANEAVAEPLAATPPSPASPTQAQPVAEITSSHGESNVATSTEAQPTIAPSTDVQASPVPAAAVALANIPDAISSSQEASADNVTSIAQTGTDQTQEPVAQSVDIANTTEAPQQQENEAEAGSSREARRDDRATSQAVSETPAPSRQKKTIADRMKSLLRDLANVTKRPSSYDALQKLKPRKIGLATDRTVADLVEHWQDPGKMIPWVCLQEVGPDILHPRAKRHMSKSMHELMDRVSNTRSVKYLTQKLPERVLTRAIMEFPRVPHMLHCWNAEKQKYFASRGSLPPNDTQPEFRFADAVSEPSAPLVGASAAPVSRSSAPPPATTSSLHLEIPEKKPELGRSGSKTPTTAPAMTQSHSVPPPDNIGSAQPNQSAALVGSVQSANQPVPSDAALAAASAAQYVQPQQAIAGPSSVAAQRQTLLDVGTQALASHIRQNLQMMPPTLPPPQSVHLTQSTLNYGQSAPQPQPANYIRQQQPQPQQLQQTLHQAFQRQTSQPVPHHPALDAAQVQRQQQAAQQQQLQEQQQQQSNAALIATAVRAAASRVFSELVADCVSFAEHVLGSGAAEEIVSREHFSEAEVLHVVEYVLDVYKREVDSERAMGRENLQAEEKYAKILKVQAAALDVLHLTKSLLAVKLCINEATHTALRRPQHGRDLPPIQQWQDLFITSPKFAGIVQHLMRGEPRVLHTLAPEQRRNVLHHKVVGMNKELESTLEKMVGIDELVGIGSNPSAGEGEDDEAVIRRECEMIAGICCKHVVDMLSD